MEGKQFFIGSPDSEPEVWQFLGTLQEEQIHDFPGAFLDFHKKKQRRMLLERAARGVKRGLSSVRGQGFIESVNSHSGALVTAH